MITAKDLMLDNIVLEFTESGWEPHKIKVSDLAFIQQRPLEVDQHFKPIPLSEKVLLACGFKKKVTLHHGTWWEIDLNKKSIRIDWSGNWYLKHGGYFLTVLQSLHHLQNGVHFITGTELTIDINKL